MVYGCISANGMVDLHMCEGTIDMEAYIGFVYCHQDCFSLEVHSCLIKTMPGLILHVPQQCWPADLSPIENI